MKTYRITMVTEYIIEANSEDAAYSMLILMIRKRYLKQLPVYLTGR